MKKYIFLALTLAANTVFACNAKDPICYDVLQSIPASITTNGGVYVESLVFKNQTGYTLVHPLDIAKVASPTGEFSYIDNCSGKRLLNNETCTVQADLTPVTSGTKTLHFVIQGYSKKQVPVPQPSVTATASGNTSVNVTGAFTANPWASTLSVGQSQNFSFSFTNSGSASVSGIGISCTNAASCSNNCGSSLAANAACTVSGTFTATSAMANTSQVVSAAFKYNQGSTVTVNSTAVHINPNTGFVGTVVPSTASLVQSQGVQVTFTFTNYSSTAITSNTVAYSGMGSGQTFMSITDGCSSGGAAANGGTCTITGTYTDTNAAPSTGILTATLTPTPATTPATSSVSSTLTVTGTNTNGARTITFVNSCPAGYNVWVGMNSAAYTVAGGSPSAPVTKTCITQSDCPTGTTCNAGTCYWNTYPTTSGSFELAPGGNTSIVIPHTDAVDAEGLDDASKIFWSGGFAGRTGCTGSGCITADCGQGTGGCQPGVGFNAPDTQAEMTLQPKTTDTYDLETIDGFNIPVSITPATDASPVSGYSCSVAGDFQAQGTGSNQFSACNWSLSANNFPTTQDPSTFYWVDTSTSHTCSTQSDCSGYPNTICGIAQVPVIPGVSAPKVAKYCGKFLGYMTAKQACAYDIPNGSVNAQALGFSCNTNTSEGGQVSNLYGCTDTYHPSCYSAGTPCCGCEKWQSTLPANSIPTSSPEQCVIQDANWLTYVPKNITWMKKTCSNVYTYPYDDKTSTFTCSNTPSANTLNYTVTFCPGGNTGIPSTYSGADGRNG